VAGRAFAFADPRVITLATKEFIPVTADDWYQRRRQDDEGVFFRKVADQGPRKGLGGATRQGIYTLTADGELLEFKNAGQDADATHEQLQRALKKWRALPAAKTQPGAVTVPDPCEPDAKYSRTPPHDGVIVKVHSRILDREGTGYVRGTCDFTGGMKAARDFLWLTADDVRALCTLEGEASKPLPMPAAVASRMARFHLIDNTRGEPRFWKSTEVAELKLTLTLQSQDAKERTFAVIGTAKMTTATQDRGYDATLQGTIVVAQGAVTGFDLVAVGDHWGDDSVTNSGCRPGRTPLGVAFTLADATTPGNRVPPQAVRDRDLYFGKRKD
jgi:hypothetical protein